MSRSVWIAFEIDIGKLKAPGCLHLDRAISEEGYQSLERDTGYGFVQ
jgi:hypothetical protein